MEDVLKQLFRSFVIVTGIELGIGEHTAYLNEKLLYLTTLCRNTEYFHKYALDDSNWKVEHYLTTLDIDTFFQWYAPEYDLAVLTTTNFDDSLKLMDRAIMANVPYILSKQNMSQRRGYTMQTFGEFDKKCFLYYRDVVQEWKFPTA